MPGVGFIGGKLSVIGGYSWPGGVDLLEEFDEVREGRKVKDHTQRNLDYCSVKSHRSRS